MNNSNQKVGFGAKIKGTVTSFFKHWNHPKEGRYVSNKEIFAYSVGGMGLQFVAAIVAQVVLNSSCILLGSIYGMTPTELTLLITINTVFSLVIQPFKSYWIDNVGAKSGKQRGKSRPFLLWMSIPTIILLPIIPFIPPALFHTHRALAVTIIGVLFVLMNFTYQFWLGMYNQLAQLISPNTTERSDIVAISSIVYSLAPTITGALFPLLSTIFPDQLLDINFYRLIFPLFTFLGFGISLLAYFGTKERIVVPKSYKAKVKFKDGMKAIASNKYFWIVTIPAWFFFARAALTACINWAYIYMLQNPAIMSVVTLFVGTASGIGMALAPLFIRLMGNKWTVIMSNTMFTVSSIFLFFFNDNFWAFIIFSYFSFFGGAVQIITAPPMHAEALDYQQLKTGDRLEGFAGNFNILTQLIALGTNFIIPAVYTNFGLTNNYDVLFDPAVRTPIFKALAIMSALGGIVCSIPYLWWDMDKEKHADIIRQLKERAIEQNKEEGFEGASFLSSDETLEDLYQDELTTDEFGNKIEKTEDANPDEGIMTLEEPPVMDDNGDEVTTNDEVVADVAPQEEEAKAEEVEPEEAKEVAKEPMAEEVTNETEPQDDVKEDK